MEQQTRAHDDLLMPALAASALLAACGGGEEPLPPAMGERSRAERRSLAGADRVHAAAAPLAGAAPAPVPTAAELMSWAERHYPEHFPGPQPDREAAPYLYRHYAATGNYLGVADGEVYVLGPISSGTLWHVGSLADFAPQVFASRWPFDDAAAARFLLQAQFSATPAEIAAVRGQGYDAWLQAQFAAAPSQSGWDWLLAKGYADTGGRFGFPGQGYPADHMLWHHLFSAPDAMRQRLALALSELFVISARVADGHNWPQFIIAAFWDLLVQHAFGNYRDLLEAVTLNVAMGYFLNTTGNQKEDPTSGRQPDENYAREVMQLFTIGLHALAPDGTVQRDARGAPIPSFGEADVSNLARVFTGYDVDLRAGYLPYIDNSQVRHPDYARKRLRVDAAKHSALAKNFLGVRVAADAPPAEALRIALDTLFKHPNVGPFVGRQMIQRLVTSDPSPAYVQRVAAAFADNGAGVRGDLRALWRAILLDEEARSPDGLSDPRFGRLREPMLCFAQWGRSFGVRSRSGYWKYNFNPYNGVQEMWQQPLRAPSVFNFFRPGYVPPGTELAAVGATAPEFQVVNESTVCSWINFLCGILFGGVFCANTEGPASGDLAPFAPGTDIDVDHAPEFALIPDWTALVQRLNLTMCAGQLSPPTVTLIAQQLGELWVHQQHQGPQGRRFMLGYALIFVMSCPEYLVQK